MSKVIQAGLIQVLNRVVEVPLCLSSREIESEENSGAGFYGVIEPAECRPMMLWECSVCMAHLHTTEATVAGLTRK